MERVHGPQDGVLVLDGAMGTALALAGVRVEGPAWSSRAVLEAPDEIAKLHAAYAAAGARVHTANTFRATRPALEAWTSAPAGTTVRDWVAKAVRIARDAVPGEHLVAGSLSPLADCYAAEPAPVNAFDLHREQSEHLAAAGVDLILCETFPNPGEALAAVEAAKTTGLPVWLALTAGPDGTLLRPEVLARTARQAAARGADVVLASCTPATAMDRFLRPLAETGVRFGAYANVGEPREALGYLVDWEEPSPPPEDMARRAARYAELAGSWVELGASVVGGCCGTTPAHLRALTKRLGCHKAQAPLH